VSSLLHSTIEEIIMNIQDKDITRFWSKVDSKGPDDCWLWTASTAVGQLDYGRFKVEGKTVKAHRFSYILAHGAIAAGQMVRHKCDTPRCVNPSHLELGSHMDNMRDRSERGRVARGFATATAILTDGEVIDIYHINLPQRQLAKMFGVSQSVVSQIKSGRTWTHITGSALCEPELLFI